MTTTFKRWLRARIRELDAGADAFAPPDQLQSYAESVRDEAARRSVALGLYGECPQSDHVPVVIDYLGRCLAALEPATLTPPQVAARYGVSPDTVRRWIESGELRAVNVGKGRPRYKIDADALAEFDRRRAPAPKPAVQRRRKPAKLLVTRYSVRRPTKTGHDS